MKLLVLKARYYFGSTVQYQVYLGKITASVNSLDSGNEMIISNNANISNKNGKISSMNDNKHGSKENR